MNNYYELMEIAEKVECIDELEKVKEIIKNISERSETGVFITGDCNSGKTTILNRIVGKKIKDPSVLWEKSKPLRVAFRISEEDVRFECHTIMNKVWNTEDVFLYEVSIEEALQFMNLADVIYYVVSAIIPFTKEDVAALKSLSCLKVKVVLNKTDLLDEDSKEKVIEYANRFSENLGFGSVLVVDDDWESVEKAFRYALPTFFERQMIRECYSKYVHSQLLKSFQKKAESMLFMNRMTHEKRLKNLLNEDIEAQEVLALWNRVRVQMLEEGEELADKVAEKIKKETEGIVNDFFEEGKSVDFHQKWAEVELPNHLKNRMQELLQEQLPILEGQIKTDVCNMMKRLENLGLTSGFNLDEFDLSNFINIYIITSSYEIQGVDVKTGMNEKNLDIYHKTTIAMGIFLICPFPSDIIGIAGALTSAGIGYGMYKRDKIMHEEKRWKIVLNEYCKKNINILTDNLITSIKDYYYQLADFISKHANDVKIPQMEDEVYVQEEKKWNEVIRKCQMFRL